MNVYVYPTDHSWFRFLQAVPKLDEVNFWQPGGGSAFNRLEPGDLFLFRLKSPINRIVGGGVFAHSSVYPLDLAWEAFGAKNGTANIADLRLLIARFKGLSVDLMPSDARIGCIILQAPFFLPDRAWIPVPSDYHLNLVQGKRWDGATPTGQSLIEAVSLALRTERAHNHVFEPGVTESLFGDPTLVKRRLGQGTFRVLVTDNFGRRCAITGERTLPVLEAAHILPVNKGGLHRSDNGLLFRSDIHTLFDLGYVTVTPDYRFNVSAALRDEYSNGRIYYELHDREIRLPSNSIDQPGKAYLEWHRDTIFRGG